MKLNFRYGEIVNINLIRDRKTGKSRGFGFLCYENQMSTDLAVDNFNGTKIIGRVIRVDHVNNYRPPKDHEDADEISKILREKGCLNFDLSEISSSNKSTKAESGEKRGDDTWAVKLEPATPREPPVERREERKRDEEKKKNTSRRRRSSSDRFRSASPVRDKKVKERKRSRSTSRDRKESKRDKHSSKHDDRDRYDKADSRDHGDRDRHRERDDRHYRR
jgi:RNA-binding motif X-linked protein 2